MRIAIVGDFDAGSATHAATENALLHAADSLGLRIEREWLPTGELVDAPPRVLGSFAGWFVAPGSPYRSLDGALRAIQLAREARKPLLGTCAGFQHVVLEFARNVLGRRDAQHAEYEPEAADLVVDRLACSLVGQRAPVRLQPGSRAASCYGADVVTEDYRCSFGLAAGWEPALERAGLAISGRDPIGEPRVVELRSHPFHLGTLFVPQLATQPTRPHPLFRAFVRAVENVRGGA
jgi:CTP synthase (UTP-ammonia lyase)